MREYAVAGTESACTERNEFVRLRQIALVARHLLPPVDDLCAVLDPKVAYRDPGVIRFIREHDDRGEGVSGVEFEALDRERAVEVAQARGLAIADEAITICGARILLR